MSNPFGIGFPAASGMWGVKQINKPSFTIIKNI